MTIDSSAVKVARDYYNSEDADNFYFQIWGGEDIHVGIYARDDEPIARASERTVETMASRLAGLGPGSRVIDAGSGFGGSARRLARQHGCRVSCVNVADVENARNRALTRAAGLDALVEVADANFEDLPCADGQFDFAWSQDALLHSGDRARALKEIDRVLKPGGEFIFTDPMQADDPPDGVLQPVLDRIHLETMGSFAFYRDEARALGWEEVDITDLSDQLPRHYGRVREELERRRPELDGTLVSTGYIDRMLGGLDQWVDKGNKGYLAWGILHFRKPG